MANLFDLISRIFISLIFLLSGYNKIFNYGDAVVWMEGFGIPGFLLWPAIVFEIILMAYSRGRSAVPPRRSPHRPIWNGYETACGRVRVFSRTHCHQEAPTGGS